MPVLNENLTDYILIEDGDALLLEVGLPSVGPGCVIPPTVEPVSLAEAKKHLRVDLTDDDELIADLISVAREHVEDVTRRAILTQTWDICLQAWPYGSFVVIPYGCLQSVDSIKWRDFDGIEHTLIEGDDYLVERNGEKLGRVVMLPSWPVGGLYPSNPITIRFTCGWTSPSLVPSRIKSAIKLLCADLYERRGDAVIGQSVTENLTVDRLLASCRLWEGI